jgi:hypothetical protein
LQSAAAADTVLGLEAELNGAFSPDQKYSFEERQGVVMRQYSTDYCTAYHQKLNGMIERRMRESIFATASFWLTAWINAGQPDLRNLNNLQLSQKDLDEFDEMNKSWKSGNVMLGRQEYP